MTKYLAFCFMSLFIFFIPHTQLPYKPNPGVSTGKCTAGWSGRQRQAKPGSIGCLHLQSGGFPDHLEKRLQCQWPQGLCTVKSYCTKHLLPFSCFSDHLWVLHITKQAFFCPKRSFFIYLITQYRKQPWFLPARGKKSNKSFYDDDDDYYYYYYY